MTSIAAGRLSTSDLDANDVTAWTLSALRRYVGGLSYPSKMPGHGYSLPAAECSTGSKLRQVTGSTCSSCYAMKGRYNFPNVKSALYRRLESIDAPLWDTVMAELIFRTGDSYFRWHDSGDLQSIGHLDRIVRVCELTPSVKHWLPTREYRIVQDWLKVNGRFPRNLNVRLSAHMVGGDHPTIDGTTGSIVVSGAARGHECPAPTTGNNCGTCRACWDPTVATVAYHIH